MCAEGKPTQRTTSFAPSRASRRRNHALHSTRVGSSANTQKERPLRVQQHITYGNHVDVDCPPWQDLPSPQAPGCSEQLPATTVHSVLLRSIASLSHTKPSATQPVESTISRPTCLMWGVVSRLNPRGGCASCTLQLATPLRHGQGSPASTHILEHRSVLVFSQY